MFVPEYPKIHEQTSKGSRHQDLNPRRQSMQKLDFSDFSSHGRSHILDDTAQGLSWPSSPGKTDFNSDKRCYSFAEENTSEDDVIRAAISTIAEDLSRSSNYFSDANGDGLAYIAKILNGCV